MRARLLPPAQRGGGWVGGRLDATMPPTPTLPPLRGGREAQSILDFDPPYEERTEDDAHVVVGRALGVLELVAVASQSDEDAEPAEGMPRGPTLDRVERGDVRDRGRREGAHLEGQG